MVFVDLGEAGSEPRAGERPRHWPGVVAALVVALALLGGYLVEDWRTASRQAALAELPGVLTPLDGPPQRVWELPDAWQIAHGGGVVAVHTADAVIGLAPQDGTQLWSQALAPGEFCASLTGLVTQSRWMYGLTTPAAPVVGTDTHLLCERHSQEMDHVPEPDSQVAFRVLDLVTGQPLAAVALEGALIGRTQFAGDLVLLTVRSDGVVLGVRLDPVTGEEVWRFRGPPDPEGEIEWLPWVWQESHQTITVRSEPEVTLALRTGEPAVRTFRPEGRPTLLQQAYPLRGGNTLEIEVSGSPLAQTSRIRDADGTVLYEVTGSLWSGIVDDGATADLVLVEEIGTGVLQALDAGTGEVRWERSGMAGYTPLVRVGNTLVATKITTVAIDLRDGSELWRVPSYAGPIAGGLTDGHVVVLAEVSRHSTTLVAHDLRDGLELWRVLLPEHTNRVSAVEGVILAETTSGLVALH